MAIVHSRFSRVFFGVSNSTGSGGLGGDMEDNHPDHETIALQLDKRINHRFAVWKHILASSCRDLLNEYDRMKTKEADEHGEQPTNKAQ